ncbi:MAG TPA: phosphate starvation-inducible protein PhoH, partial [Thalassospira sp.]|nr:phosphate starvation-inducible protein PhoH [Thalassospira sp.]
MSGTPTKSKTNTKTKHAPKDSDQIEFQDNALAQVLYGPQAENLTRLSERTGVQVSSRGLVVMLAGDPAKVAQVKKVLSQLYARLRDKEIDNIDVETVDGAVRLSEPDDADPWSGQTKDMFGGSRLTIQTKKRRISPRSKRQKDYVEAILDNELIFGIGPAGTGKT